MSCYKVDSPFVEDGAGNLLYFDYRMNENQPSIVFQHHERAISKDDLNEWDLKERPLEEWFNDSLIPVVDSFERLLEMMYPSEW
ncbi:SMI1/KNR4 family protein [Neobacillus citreus]|uniref:SMI1/KNR4 family protein n=2 Tax=Neobacillus citreus TaxID=2833578 RepID=A0A9J6MRI5_9BACI|nr:SMI1/KNR4 family protein [Neobacillus citreus]MCH6267137.1 SMI1/KNR4 family protein [Neobacillus citreus]